MAYVMLISGCLVGAGVASVVLRRTIYSRHELADSLRETFDTNEE